MRFISLKLSNIRSYTAETITFPQAAVLLSGDIGSGKSTILLAIEFALFGVIRGSVDGASLLRHGRNAGSVELTFELDGKEIIVFRQLKRTKTAVSQTAGCLVVNGVRTDLTPVELKAKILDLLGYPKSLVTKSKSLIYRYTVYTPQEEMKHILFEDSLARVDTLRKVFQIDNYKTMRDNATIIARLLREKKNILAAKIEDLPVRKQQLKEYQLQLEGKRKELDLLFPKVKDAQEKIDKQRLVLQKLEDDQKAQYEVKQKIATTLATISSKQSTLTSLNQQLSSITLEAPSFDMPKYEGVVGKLAATTEELSKLLASKQQLEKELFTVSNDLSIAVEEIGKAQAIHDETIHREKRVAIDDCPVCMQPIAPDHKITVLNQIDVERKKAKERMEKSAARKAELLEKQKDLQSRLDGLQEKQSLHAQLHSALSVASQHVSVKPTAVSDATLLLREVQRLSQEYITFTHQQQMHADRLRQREGISAQITTIQQELTTLKSEGAQLEQKLNPAIEQTASRERTVLDELQAAHQNLLIQKSSIESTVSHLQTMVSNVTLEIESKKQAESQLHSANQYHVWLTDFFVQLTETIEKHVMLRIYTQFNELFQSWFSILMEDETISARLDDSFSPVVEINGYETPLENLSGGEKTSCALAYRLALNKVINDVIESIKTKDVIILDEPTDGFSSQQLEKVRDLLEQLNLPQVIIVSHEQKIESFVQHVVRIVKEQHVSRVLV